MKLFYTEDYETYWTVGQADPMYVREYFLLGVLLYRKTSKQPWGNDD